jgi:metal-sulfur cluster biosynthetic enzyme
MTADGVLCELPAGYDGSALLRRLAQVLDPELDQSILDLGFVRRLRLDGGRAEIELQLPTSWCAVNFAYLMAEDVRRALLGMADIHAVTVRLGDHCAAGAIEAAVNAARPFAEAFSGEGGGSLEALRLTFLRKGFVIRQERLLHELRVAGVLPAAVCGLRLGELTTANGKIMIRQPDGTALESGPAAILRSYLERRAALGLGCDPAAPLIIGLDGQPVAAARLEDHYQRARTMRVALEANGSFCRALIERTMADATGIARPKTGGRHVPA